MPAADARRLTSYARHGDADSLLLAAGLLGEEATIAAPGTATTLDDLLALDGVVAAGEFTPDGKLLDYEATMDMSPELAAMSAQFCATVSMLFGTLSSAFTPLSGMNWSPPVGWSFAGGDYTVAVAGGRGVFVETAKADFNKLFEALVGSR